MSEEILDNIGKAEKLERALQAYVDAVYQALNISPDSASVDRVDLALAPLLDAHNELLRTIPEDILDDIINSIW